MWPVKRAFSASNVLDSVDQPDPTTSKSDYSQASIASSPHT